jgi:hypothetical protein
LAISIEVLVFTLNGLALYLSITPVQFDFQIMSAFSKIKSTKKAQEEKNKEKKSQADQHPEPCILHKAR